MRPEKASNIINNAIQLYLKGDKTAMYKRDTLQALNKMFMKQVIWHENHGYNFEEMYNTDVDIDNEYDTEDYINGHMMYISDRWNAPQRLQWLITGIQEKKF